MAGENDDRLARQLLAQAEAIARLRRETEKLAEETSESTANLIARVEALEDADLAPTGLGHRVASWCWRHIGPLGEEALWKELTDWVGWIRHRYPLARRIPACWAEHPEVVEELTALWLAWQAAYVDTDGSLTAAAEWHDRWLPGLLYRLEHGPFALDCDAAHHPRPAGAYAPAAEDPLETPATQQVSV
jgi:hypothetical protein